MSIVLSIISLFWPPHHHIYSCYRNVQSRNNNYDDIHHRQVKVIKWTRKIQCGLVFVATSNSQSVKIGEEFTKKWKHVSHSINITTRKNCHFLNFKLCNSDQELHNLEIFSLIGYFSLQITTNF